MLPVTRAKMMHTSDGHADEGVDHLLARVGDGTPGDELLELHEGDGTPEKDTVPMRTPSSTSAVTYTRRLEPEVAWSRSSSTMRSGLPRRHPRR